jgi:uncharacterized membrane protein YGL010W
VPIILWTALVWVAGAVGPLVPGLDLGFGHLPYGPFAVNGAFLVITVYALFYVLLEPVAGVRHALLHRLIHTLLFTLSLPALKFVSACVCVCVR